QGHRTKGEEEQDQRGRDDEGDRDRCRLHDGVQVVRLHGGHTTDQGLLGPVRSGFGTHVLYECGDVLVVGLSLVGDLDVGDVLAGAVDVGTKGPGQCVEAFDVLFESFFGGASHHRDVDASDLARGKVFVHGFHGHTALGVRGQVTLVGGAQIGRGQPGGECRQDTADRDQGHGLPTHHLSRQTGPGSVALLDPSGGGTAGQGQLEVVDAVSDHGHAGGQEDQGCQEVEEDHGDAAPADGLEDGLGEEQQAAEGDPHDDPGEGDRAARCVDSAAHCVVYLTPFVEFLTETTDHEQPIVDRQPQPEESGHVDG